MNKNMMAFITANLLTTITIYVIMFISLATHEWISEWWFAAVWLGWQLVMFAAVHQKPRSDREMRPWLYRGEPADVTGGK